MANTNYAHRVLEKPISNNFSAKKTKIDNKIRVFFQFFFLLNQDVFGKNIIVPNKTGGNLILLGCFTLLHFFIFY